jgi:hypothetical protein
MPEFFLNLEPAQRKEIITTAAVGLGILPAIAEKDIWVCFVLDALFSIKDGRPMVFKGGTSLSKVFDLIKRFSEDIDISVNFIDEYGIVSKTKASNIRDEIDEKLQTYKNEIIVPRLQELGEPHGLSIEDGDTPWEIHVTYSSELANNVAYLKPRVKIEFSGRNETEPSQKHTVKPYLLEGTDDLIFPEATIDVLDAERTFWEKVTLIHAALNSGNMGKSAERMSRHWSDVSVMMKNGIGGKALQDQELCRRVVDHKTKFWRDSKAKYEDCLTKNFRLVPSGSAYEDLKNDYDAMTKAGMFFDESCPNFEATIADILALQDQLNA